jgi:CheY-like chemotaxis protein
MKGDREDCLSAGMDAYIAKPIHVEEFFSVIEDVLTAGLSMTAELPCQTA